MSYWTNEKIRNKLSIKTQASGRVEPRQLVNISKDFAMSIAKQHADRHGLPLAGIIGPNPVRKKKLVEIRRDIVTDILRSKPNATIMSIARRLNLDPTTVRYALDKRKSLVRRNAPKQEK